MKIIDLLKMGLRNLKRRKARTALTVIGMVIGTISIMVMVSISIGVNESVNKYLLENGSLSIITISKYSYSVDEDGNYNSKTQTIDDKLVAKIKEIDHVRAVSPKINVSAQLVCGKYSTWIDVYAMDCSTFEEFGFPALTEGKYPTPESNSGIAIGSQAIWGEFYYYSGRTRKTKDVDFSKDKVYLKFNDYQVKEGKKEFAEFIGKNYGMMEESDNWMYNYSVYMDMDYFKEIYTKYAATLSAQDRKAALKKIETYNEVQINVDNLKNVTEVQEAIEKLGYKTQSDMEYIQPMLDTASMLEKVLFGIGVIAMLVSAINIANTMIMSIYERTKEIGIMKVLGCTLTDIKKLFLFEAGMLGLIGGVIGIAFSYGASYLINKYGAGLLGSLMGTGTMGAGAMSIIPFWLPFAAALGTIIVGVISGYVPARRATRISAIEAMKSEG